MGCEMAIPAGKAHTKPQQTGKEIWLRRLPVIGLLVTHAALLAYSAAVHSPTVDEPTHLVAGVYHWQHGQFNLDRGNPPLTGLVAAGPVLLAGPQSNWRNVPYTYRVARDFQIANGPRTCYLTILGRMACIVFSLLGGLFCFLWARDLYSYGSGLTALALWSFDPNILAHGQLITGDVAAAAMGIASFYFFWRWLSQPSMGRTMLTGTFLGLAELSKFVWVVLYPLWPLLWVIWRLINRRQTTRLSVMRELGQLAVILLLGLYIINLGYVFEGSFKPLEQFAVGKRMMEMLPGGEQSPLAGFLCTLPVPLPENYVGGVDEIVEISDGLQYTYLRGQWRKGGWWYFYPFVFAVKFPLGTLGLLGMAVLLTPWQPGLRKTWKTELLLLLSIVVMTIFIYCAGPTQQLRYCLPVFPLLAILISKTYCWFAEHRLILGSAFVLLMSWTILSSLWAYPHSMSYFNEIAGGPLKCGLLLSEGNVDYGQDFFYLKHWLKNHPEVSRLGLLWKYPPTLDPRILNLDYHAIPSAPVVGHSYNQKEMMQLGPQPGWFATTIYGFSIQKQSRYFLDHFKPVAHAGYSIYIYHITLDDANRVRRELGLEELAGYEGQDNID